MLIKTFWLSWLTTRLAATATAFDFQPKDHGAIAPSTALARRDIKATAVSTYVNLQRRVIPEEVFCPRHYMWRARRCSPFHSERTWMDICEILRARLRSPRPLYDTGPPIFDYPQIMDPRPRFQWHQPPLPAEWPPSPERDFPENQHELDDVTGRPRWALAMQRCPKDYGCIKLFADRQGHKSIACDPLPDWFDPDHARIHGWERHPDDGPYDFGRKDHPAPARQQQQQQQKEPKVGRKQRGFQRVHPAPRRAAAAAAQTQTIEVVVLDDFLDASVSAALIDDSATPPTVIKPETPLLGTTGAGSEVCGPDLPPPYLTAVFPDDGRDCAPLKPADYHKGDKITFTFALPQDVGAAVFRWHVFEPPKWET